MLTKLLESLKPKQLTAVQHSEGPLLIIAGAGTGKTTTITAKIAHMVEKDGIQPEHILALTFSKEAAGNMERKVRELLGENRDVKVSTFHSFCAEIIRDNSRECGISDDFSIFQEIDSAIFFYSEVGIDVRNATLYANTISKAKDLTYQLESSKSIQMQKKTCCCLLQKKMNGRTPITITRSNSTRSI